MASFGTAEIEVRLDAGRVLAVIGALELLSRLLADRYGHVWTDEEKAILAGSAAACERANLVYTADPS